MGKNLFVKRVSVFVTFIIFSFGVCFAADVTFKHLRNADFSAGPIVSVDIFAYKASVTNGAVYGPQDVEGWSYAVESGNQSDPDCMGSGVFAYGSSNALQGNGTLPPAAGPDGNPGTCLGFLAIWSCGGYYYQDVMLPAGDYTISVPTYNAGGTSAYTSHIGFVADDGAKHIIQTIPTVGTWTVLSTSFTLTHETQGKIVLGYVAPGAGSGSVPKLFFDNVTIESTEWIDCTENIQNPGFDEDISFNADASAAKEYVSHSEWTDAEGRSGTMHKTADGSIYNEDSGTLGYNAAGKPNWDGFKAHIRGWELTNKRDTALWIYYGSLPYSLEEGMMKLGDGVMGGESVPNKPAAINDGDNKGLLYLKAGWSNACSYKQTIRNLDRAKYKLCYYIRNTNVDKSRLYADATNLCNVTCNGVTFVDDEGFNSKGWILHSIEFIPVDSFSIEFGCRASNNFSYNNPILWIDGIQLYKMGDASDEDVAAAYQRLVDTADSLSNVLHFSGDRQELQQAISEFNSNKDYVQLYQAIRKASASEKKYQEIMKEDALIQTVASALGEAAYGCAADIVQFAYTKVMNWVVADDATYVDADTYMEKLNVYACIYAPIFVEADNVVKAYAESETEVLCQLMNSQKSSLIASEMLDADIVQQYADTLRNAIDDIILKESVTFTGTYQTYCGAMDLDFAKVEGLKAYVASSYNPATRTLIMTEVGQVAAGTPVLLVGTAGTEYEIHKAKTPSCWGGLLRGVLSETSLTATEGDVRNLVLTGERFEPVGESHTLEANRAYLQLPQTWADGSVTIAFCKKGDVNDDGVLSIADVTKLVNMVLGK